MSVWSSTIGTSLAVRSAQRVPGRCRTGNDTFWRSRTIRKPVVPRILAHAIGCKGNGADVLPRFNLVDIVTLGAGPEDCWAIETKHRRGAITGPMVERFLRGAQIVAEAHQLSFARL
jgi:hypothetical protein